MTEKGESVLKTAVRIVSRTSRRPSELVSPTPNPVLRKAIEIVRKSSMGRPNEPMEAKMTEKPKLEYETTATVSPFNMTDSSDASWWLPNAAISIPYQNVYQPETLHEIKSSEKKSVGLYEIEVEVKIKSKFASASIDLSKIVSETTEKIVQELLPPQENK